jgi:hypothetical protein
MKPEDLQPIPRQRYYDGQLLKLADFQREQDFHRASRELQTQLLFTPGVVVGLNVSAGAATGEISVQPGLAIDDSGRQIILASAGSFGSDIFLQNGVFTLDLRTDKKIQSKTCLLVIEYGSEENPPDAGQWNDYPQFSLVDSVAEGQISLASLDITISGTGAKEVIEIAIDTSARVNSELISGQPQNISAEQITSGVIDAERIPDLSADKITSGAFGLDRIPDIPFSKITGEIDAKNVPALSADKITSGEFDIDRIPDVPASKITGELEKTQIPPLDASQIGSSVFDIERIPDIPAAKIAGKLTVEQLPDDLPDNSFAIDVDKPNISGEEIVSINWNGAVGDEIHLEYVSENQIVAEIWKPISNVKKGWQLTPYETIVCTLTAYKTGEIDSRRQFVVQVVQNEFQYLKSLYFRGAALADALLLCVNRYRLLPLTTKNLQALAAAAGRANYSEDEALKILQTYPQKISELATPVITDFSNTTDSDFVVSWNQVADADGYELEMSDPNGAITSRRTDGATRNLTITLADEPVPGNYQIQIRAFADEDVFSEWSARAGVNIPEPKASVHHWAFDEANGLTASDSIGKIKGTLAASVRRVSPGCVGAGAVHIDGSDGCFVTFGTKVGQFKRDDFTVALWFRTSETYRYFDVVGNRTSGSNGNFFCLRMTGIHESEPAGMLITEVDEDGNNYISVWSSRTNLNDGNWHHAAVVRAGQTLRIYVDGEFSSEGAAAGAANISNGNDFRLGRSLQGVTDKFAPDADYDELYVFDSALSAAEISNLFRARDKV